MAHEGKWERLGDGSLLTQDADEGLGHIVPIKTSFMTLIALIILTVVTVWTAKYVDLGDLNIVLALFIASIKAAIVGTYFMHLKFENGLILAYVIYPLVLLVLLIGGSFMDIAERWNVHDNDAMSVKHVETDLF